MRSGPPTGAEEEQSLEAPEPIDIRDPNHKQIEPAALVLSHGDYAGDIGQVTNITDPEYNEEGELVTPQILVLFPDYEEPVSFDTSHKGGGDRETGDGEPDWFLCEELEVTDSDRWRATEVEAYGQQERPMSEPASEETINVSRSVVEQSHEAIRAAAKLLITLEETLKQPYSDDPRWSPWTRFVARNEYSPWNLLIKADTRLRAALDGAEKQGENG